MRQKVVALIAGLIIGAVAMTVLPVQAHHNDLRFKRRLNRLENQVSILKQKTVDLDREGFFYGPIMAEQVISLCPDGSSTVWISDGNAYGISWLDGCFSTQSEGGDTRSQSRQTLNLTR